MLLFTAILAFGTDLNSVEINGFVGICNEDVGSSTGCTRISPTILALSNSTSQNTATRTLVGGRGLTRFANFNIQAKVKVPIFAVRHFLIFKNAFPRCVVLCGLSISHSLCDCATMDKQCATKYGDCH